MNLKGTLLALLTLCLAGFRASGADVAAQGGGSAQSSLAEAPALTNFGPEHLLLLDNLGRLVGVPTNQLRPSLLPPPGVGLQRQSPNPVEGIAVPPEVLRRQRGAREELAGWHFLPAIPPRLMPYLASFDDHGNTALRPGALLPFVPLDPFVQEAKYYASAYGLRYALEQSFTYMNLTDVKQGDNTLGFYSMNLKAKWALFDAQDAGTAGWITAQVEAKTGLGAAGATQSPKSNLGTLTEPNYNWSSVNGFRVPELAWQQSLRDGEVVVVAGMVSQRNYLDGNATAHTARGEFMNSALVHSQVMPLADYNFGANLQWQPADEWYAMLGASAGDTPAGSAPWTGFTWQHWSVVGEFSYAPREFLGLGDGVYRLQPFVASAGGPTQAGFCFNAQQRLAPHSPFAWFGRFGFGGAQVAAGAEKQVGTGFVWQAPLDHIGLVPKLSNDLLGIGFVWSQPSATRHTVFHENEYVLETFYALQLTPTMTLQPDLQVVWNPAFNPSARSAIVAQLQLNLVW